MNEKNGFTMRASLSMIDKRGPPGKWNRKYVPKKKVSAYNFKPAIAGNGRRSQFIGNQLDLILDLINCGFIGSDDLAKAWQVAASKALEGSYWKKIKTTWTTPNGEENLKK